MKVIFTASKNPNFFSRLIAAFEQSKWTHVCIETDVKTPLGEPLVMHSVWNSGVSLAPASVVIGSKDTKVYEDDSSFNWILASQVFSKYAGGHTYGWAQVIGHALRVIGVKEPEWILKRYEAETYCSEFIIRMAAARGLMRDLDPNRTGPGALEKYMAMNANFRKVDLI